MVIQDVVCYVPPPGFVFDRMTNKVVEAGIYSRSENPSEQYWEIPPEPNNYAAKRKAEKLKQRTDPDFHDQELAAYINREWFRRLNGFWFMNNGKPEFIAGDHYFHLAHWPLDDGMPDFRWPEQIFYYVWNSAWEDPYCAGVLNFANRRNGKSSRLGSIMFERTSRTRNALSSLQSKTEADGKKFFEKHIVRSFKKLKDFFIPVYDTSLGKTPKTKIRFFDTVKLGKEAVDYEFVDALDSELDYREPSARALDGTRQLVCGADEFAKLSSEHSILERHRTNKYTILKDGRFVGKMLYCSTAEEMTSGDNIRESKELWDTSDPKVRLDNKRTPSGLYRFWLPADHTLEYDRYGYPLIEQNRETLLSDRNFYLSQGDFAGYASECRKNPLSIDDIFRVAVSRPVWDTIKIGTQIAVLQAIPEDELFTVGNFVWEGGVRDSRVVFVRTKMGRFKICPEVLEELEREAQNLQRPKNKHRFVAGCDPFEQDIAKGGSEAAAYARKLKSLTSPILSESPVLEYCGRPSSNTFFEDMIKMVVFFGIQINVENNISGLIKYITDRGYGAFLYWFPNATKPGIYASTESKDLAAGMVEEDVNANIQNYRFAGLLEQMQMFSLSDSTKFDRAMAWMWTVLACGNSAATKKETKEMPSVRQIIRKHKIRR